MADSNFLTIAPGVAVPRSELEYRASRSGGPGGQHVNTASTRIELLWNLETSRVLTEEQRARLRTRLASRLDSTGAVRVVSSARRSQQQNKQAADERLAALVRHALHVPKRRRVTKRPKAANERRLSEKKHRGTLKRDRRAQPD
jgi:ribosome-associated protein